MADNPALYLTRIDPEANMRRYYRLELAADLFGGVVVLRQWGRIGTRGQERREWFKTLKDAETHCHVWAMRKIRRGYSAATGAASVSG